MLLTPHSRALIPSALKEELLGWVILFKDLLQKTSLAHDEARLILGSLSFLRVYARRRPGAQGERSIFDGPFAPLAHIVAELRHLREQVRDELVLVELLFLPDRRYEQLITAGHVDEDDGVHDDDHVRSAAITARPLSFEERRKRYMASLPCPMPDDGSPLRGPPGDGSDRGEKGVSGGLPHRHDVAGRPPAVPATRAAARGEEERGRCGPRSEPADRGGQAARGAAGATLLPAPPDPEMAWRRRGVPRQAPRVDQDDRGGRTAARRHASGSQGVRASRGQGHRARRLRRGHHPGGAWRAAPRGRGHTGHGAAPGVGERCLRVGRPVLEQRALERRAGTRSARAGAGPADGADRASAGRGVRSPLARRHRARHLRRAHHPEGAPQEALRRRERADGRS